jgi:hypothetical protein
MKRTILLSLAEIATGALVSSCQQARYQIAGAEMAFSLSRRAALKD